MKKYLLILTILFLFFQESLFSIQKFQILEKRESGITIELENQKQDSLLIILQTEETKHIQPNALRNYTATVDMKNLNTENKIDNNNIVIYYGNNKLDKLQLENLKINTDYIVHVYTIKKKKGIRSFQKENEYQVSTLALQPSKQSRDIAFKHPAKTDEIEILWIKGNGEKSIVICREKSEKGDVKITYPSNGKQYKPGFFGNKESEIENSQNYVVYEGKSRKDNRATIKGLKPGTLYQFEILEANGENDKIHYLIPNNVSNNPRAIFTAFLPPKALAASELTNNSFIANWEPINYAEGYYIDVAEDINFEKKLSGYDNMDVGNYSEWAVQGLEKGKTYYYRVKALSKTRFVTDYSNIIKVEIK